MNCELYDGNQHVFVGINTILIYLAKLQSNFDAVRGLICIGLLIIIISSY